MISLAPETRIVWASAAARAEWEPKIVLADIGYQTAERETVAQRMRQAGQVWLGIQDYLAFLPWVMERSLTARVVRWTGRHQRGFTHLGYPPGNDMVVVVFGQDLREPYDELFGYPHCCRAFFAREFPGDADPIPAWGGTVGFGVEPMANPLLRYIGVRPVAHIPCGPRCMKTLDMAKRFLSTMPPEAADATEELLSLPMKWDRYRGVAIIDTPHFKVVATSTARPTREIVEVGHHVVCR